MARKPLGATRTQYHGILAVHGCYLLFLRHTSLISLLRNRPNHPREAGRQNKYCQADTSVFADAIPTLQTSPALTCRVMTLVFNIHWAIVVPASALKFFAHGPELFARRPFFRQG